MLIQAKPAWAFWHMTVHCHMPSYMLMHVLQMSTQRLIVSWALTSQRNHYHGAKCNSWSNLSPSPSLPLGRRGPFKHLRGSTPGMDDNSAKELSKRIAPWRANGRFGSPQPRYTQGCLSLTCLCIYIYSLSLVLPAPSSTCLSSQRLRKNK